MVNVNKLKGKVVECGISISELAVKIGIDKATLYRKLAENGETFSIREADLISKSLGMTLSEVNAIFFTQFVALNANNQIE